MSEQPGTGYTRLEKAKIIALGWVASAFKFTVGIAPLLIWQGLMMWWMKHLVSINLTWGHVIFFAIVYLLGAMFAVLFGFMLVGETMEGENDG